MRTYASRSGSSQESSKAAPASAVQMVMKHAALVDLVLSGVSVSREMADLVMAGSDEFEEPVTGVFSRAVVAGELESLHSAGLDEES